MYKNCQSQQRKTAQHYVCITLHLFWVSDTVLYYKEKLIAATNSTALS